MKQLNYESPELDIRWFESVDVIAISQPIVEEETSDGINPDDEW